MPNRNYHEVCGHLGQNPDVSWVPSGRSYCRFNVATSNDFFDREKGDWVKRDPSWHRVVIWGPLGDLVAERFKRGSSIMVRGRSHTRKYTGEDGIERFVTELIGTEVYKPIYVKRDRFGEPEDPQMPEEQEAQNGKSFSLRGEDEFITDIQGAVKEGKEDTDFPFGNNVKGRGA